MTPTFQEEGEANEDNIEDIRENIRTLEIPIVSFCNLIYNMYRDNKETIQV